MNPWVEVLYYRGRMALDADRPSEAVQPLRELVRRLPEYARARLLLAVALHRTGHSRAAAAELATAYRLHPTLRDGIYRPSDILEAAAERRPELREAQVRLAELARLHGDYLIAIRAWRKVERAHGLTPAETGRVGAMYLRAGRPERAVEYLQKALAANPDLASVKGDLRRAQKRLALLAPAAG
jgi:tetratricopeptide (TPR) repeat protein